MPQPHAILSICPIIRGYKIHAGTIWLGAEKGIMLKNCTSTALCADLLLAAAHAADLHTCKLSADRRSVTVLVSNPYQQETHCTVNCHVTFPGEGINIVSITCTKTVPGGAKDFELCSRTRHNNRVFVKLADAGNSECVKPLAEQKSDKDEDDDDRFGEQIRKQGEEMLRMLKKK